MRIGSLFSGYGGLDAAVVSVLGGDVAWHVEFDKAPSAALAHRFPGVPNYGDVTSPNRMVDATGTRHLLHARRHGRDDLADWYAA